MNIFVSEISISGLWSKDFTSNTEIVVGHQSPVKFVYFSNPNPIFMVD